MPRQYKKKKSIRDLKYDRASETQRKRSYRQRISSAVTAVIKRPKPASVIKKRAAERQRKYYAKHDKK